MSSEEKKYVIKVGDKEIEITTEVLEILNEYIHTAMPLEKLAEKLGLESWEEAYEFIKKVPAWIMWTPPTLWEHRKKWMSR
ncbi:MAG: hypothetical protein DRO40_11635 [Thermoprotei archaeon]|nr:MAG: hypothetical protein DRO40_11635 [Thermoprotei archaeon]